MSIEQSQKLMNSVDMLSRTQVQPDRKELRNDEELVAAKNVLINNQFLNFPRIVKSINDPIILNQEFGLFSFTPAHDVKPNKSGIYGVFKSRGNFATLEESQVYAEKLIRTQDSYNEIYTIRVGQCIPLTKKSELVEETEIIDLNKEVDSIVAKDVKEKRQKEKQEMKSIQEREQKLLKENAQILSGDYAEDPLDRYIMMKVKKAQLLWTLVETRKRINKEIIPAILKTKSEIEEMDREYPEFDKQYYDRYISARESVGIQDRDKLNYSYFMKYLLDDNNVDLTISELEE